jgi:hypothetical protein
VAFRGARVTGTLGGDLLGRDARAIIIEVDAIHFLFPPGMKVPC